MFLIHQTKTRVAARVYNGMWIADCLICCSALWVDRFKPAFDCWECGSRSEIAWPDHDFVMGVERLLLMRPLRYSRNWQPGETLADLMAQNAEHGVFDVLKPLAEANPGSSLLAVTDNEIRTDMLPVTRQRELRAVTR